MGEKINSYLLFSCELLKLSFICGIKKRGLLEYKKKSSGNVCKQ